MNIRRYLVVFLVIIAAIGFAQEISGKLADIKIVGDTDNNTIIKALIKSRVGDDVSQIDLESERNLVLSIGLFKKVVVSLEKQDAGPILVIEVEPNPKIRSATVEGSSLLTQDQIEEFLRRNLIEVGATLNTARADSVISNLVALYRQRGYPFNVEVHLKVTPSDITAEDGSDLVDVVYTINEGAKLNDVEADSCTVLSNEEVQEIFKPLANNKKFNFDLYRKSVDTVAKKYYDAGYRGSGIDNTGKTNLSDGTLKLVCRELRVSSIDSSAIGVDEDQLSLKVGDLFNYDLLLADAKKFSNELDKDVNFAQPIIVGDTVRLRFLAGPPETAGKIEKIEIVGNTVIPTEDLKAVLELKEGDNFSSAIAAEDFSRLYDLYDSAGYIVARQPQFNFLDGVYSQKITEIKIAGYEVHFDRENPKSKEFLLTRYLPKPGTVFNRNSFTRGVQNALRLGAFEVVGQPEFKPSDKPDEVTVVINLKERSTAIFSPGLSYTIGSGATTVETGFEANVSYEDTNFLGRGHTAGIRAAAKTSDIGFLLGGSLNYSIPWLYLDELDFKENPTRISFSLFSNFNANQAMSAKDGTKICLDPDKRENNDCDDDTKVLIGDYTQRETGFGLSAGRRVAPFTTVGVSTRISYNSYILEPGQKCELDDEGKLTNAADCALPDDEAREFLPQEGFASKIGTSISYDDRDNLNFPRSGVHADASIALGFGNDYRNKETKEVQGYTYVPVEFGVRTYLKIDETDPNHVFAVKFTAGHQFGGEYPSDRYFVVGGDGGVVGSRLLRGFTRADINPSQSYAIGTLEYRYDFGLDTIATDTVIGYVYLDLGWASQMPGFVDYTTPFLAGAGLCVQLNLGFSGISLPPVRLDYTFSQNHPSGVFGFRFGPVF